MFEGVAYTGAQMRPVGWFHDVIIDLAGVDIPDPRRPVLRLHNHDKITGHTQKITVSKKDGNLISGVFSGEQKYGDAVLIPARNGFRWQLSVGADPVRTEFLEAGETETVNGRKVVGPLTISRETRLGEISFVPLGADQDTEVTISGSLAREVRALARQAAAAIRAGRTWTP
jgi:hypothetical protein